jgi:glycosyltransferase involved in cell wall biosynthesis
MSDKKFSILLILEGGYPWYFGGVSEWTHQYLKHLSGYDISILQIVNEPWLSASYEQAIYPFEDNTSSFQRISAPNLHANISLDKVSDWVDKQLKNFDFTQDVIHVTNTGFAGILGAALANNNDKPLVLTEHAIYWKEIELGAQSLECGYQISSQNEYKERVKNIFKSISRKLYKTTNNIISVSRSNLPWQKKLGAQNIQYIPNGIPSSFIETDRQLRTTEKQTPVVGWIGRCARIKQPLVFLKVAKELHRVMGGDIRFKMLLSDSGEDDLKAKVQEKSKDIKLLTVLWNQPAEEHLSSMDALFITSQSESQPLVMLEALGKKVLPFGWKVGDATERYGIFEESDADISNIATRFKELWKSPAEWKQAVESRHQLIKEQHQWKTIFSHYKDVIHDIS